MSEFIKTDVDIAFDIGTGFVRSDVDNITIQVEKSGFQLTKSLNNGVYELDGAFVLSILRTEVINPGVYNLYARITDTSGKQRGIRLDPNKLTFVDFPINA